MISIDLSRFEGGSGQNELLAAARRMAVLILWMANDPASVPAVETGSFMAIQVSNALRLLQGHC
ncbi:hypothetical protein G6N76_06580 [Rhizobium daejeonense]|uniref:Uncharacterized protein n=1 Tax=Rhizobium daejeonense TaxID=240521 RepID=A0A6M1RP29_9HYPH|nr:hypothetical protein [Rhizobium daejeonense]NGO63334.1 hypothetical protein [Rhizobium daejeonense]